MGLTKNQYQETEDSVAAVGIDEAALNEVENELPPVTSMGLEVIPEVENAQQESQLIQDDPTLQQGDVNLMFYDDISEETQPINSDINFMIENMISSMDCDGVLPMDQEPHEQFLNFILDTPPASPEAVGEVSVSNSADLKPVECNTLKELVSGLIDEQIDMMIQENISDITAPEYDEAADNTPTEEVPMVEVAANEEVPPMTETAPPPYCEVKSLEDDHTLDFQVEFQNAISSNYDELIAAAPVERVHKMMIRMHELLACHHSSYPDNVDYNEYIVGCGVLKYIYCQLHSLFNEKCTSDGTAELGNIVSCHHDHYCSLDPVAMDLSIIGFDEAWLREVIANTKSKNNNFPDNFLEYEITYMDKKNYKKFDFKDNLPCTRQSKNVDIVGLYDFILKALTPYMSADDKNALIEPYRVAKIRYDVNFESFEMKFVLDKKEFITRTKSGRKSELSMKTAVEVPLNKMYSKLYKFEEGDLIHKVFYKQGGVRIARNESKKGRLECEYENLSIHTIDCVINRMKYALINTAVLKRHQDGELITSASELITYSADVMKRDSQEEGYVAVVTVNSM